MGSRKDIYGLWFYSWWRRSISVASNHNGVFPVWFALKCWWCRMTVTSQSVNLSISQSIWLHSLSLFQHKLQMKSIKEDLKFTIVPLITHFGKCTCSLNKDNGQIPQPVQWIQWTLVISGSAAEFPFTLLVTGGLECITWVSTYLSSMSCIKFDLVGLINQTLYPGLH